DLALHQVSPAALTFFQRLSNGQRDARVARTPLCQDVVVAHRLRAPPLAIWSLKNCGVSRYCLFSLSKTPIWSPSTAAMAASQWSSILRETSEYHWGCLPVAFSGGYSPFSRAAAISSSLFLCLTILTPGTSWAARATTCRHQRAGRCAVSGRDACMSSSRRYTATTGSRRCASTSSVTACA